MSKPYQPNGKEYLFVIKKDTEIQAYIGTSSGLKSLGEFQVLDKKEKYDINNLNLMKYENILPIHPMDEKDTQYLLLRAISK